MGDQIDCPKSKNKERREALNIFKELWETGNSPLHRMYSSWVELERNIDVESSLAEVEKGKVQPCPYCGAKQKVSRPLDGVFPYWNCESCKRPFMVQGNLKVKRISDEEKIDIPVDLIQVVEDLSKKKVAVVLRLE